MSTTFTCPEAPYKTQPCQFCQDWRERGWIEEGEHCDEHCDGTEEVPTAPNVEVGYGIVPGLLRVLGWSDPDTYLGGSCSPGELRQRILRARNRDLSVLVEDPYELAPGHAGMAIGVNDQGVTRLERRGPRVIFQGVDEDRIHRYLDGLEALAIWAQERGFQISWA